MSIGDVKFSYEGSGIIPEDSQPAMDALLNAEWKDGSPIRTRDWHAVALRLAGALRHVADVDFPDGDYLAKYARNALAAEGM